MLIDTLRALCAISGPAGDESRVRDWIRQTAEPWADRILDLPHGGLLIGKEGKKRPVKTQLLSAHMDEPALLIRSVTDQGFLKFSVVGGLDRRALLGKQVRIGPKAIPGIVGMKPIHLTSKTERKSVPETKSLYLDIGAGDKAAAEALVEVGDYACLEAAWQELPGGRIRARALDSRLGCAVLLELLQRPLPADTWFAFTTLSEVGNREAYAAAFAAQPSVTLTLDAAQVWDLPTVEEAKQGGKLGAGPILSRMDEGTIFDPGLMERLETCAGEANLPVQVAAKVAGSCEAKAYQQSGKGGRAAAILVPVRYRRSPAATLAVSDLEAALELTAGFLARMEVRA